MSPYLQKFFDMSVKEHFNMLYHGIIGFNGSIIMSCIVVVVLFLTFVALPYVFGRVILERERKIRNKIYICMIDIGLVGLLAFIGGNMIKEAFNTNSRKGVTFENYRASLNERMFDRYSTLERHRELTAFLQNQQPLHLLQTHCLQL